MAKKVFQVYNVTAGDSIATIEMDDELLQQDGLIVDHKTMTLRPIKNGGHYTLEPVDHPKVRVLKRVKECYENCTDKPAKYLTTHFQRMDEMLGVVGLLFNEVTLTVVESRDDLDKIINPPRGDDYEPKTRKLTILGDLLAEAEAEAAGEDGHVHGPNCKH